MRPHIERIALPLLLGAVLALGQARVSTAASPSPAAPGATPITTPPTSGTLNVSPPIISLNIAPGGTGSTQLTVHSAIVQNVQITAAGLGQGPDGAFQPLVAAKDTSPYSGRAMMSVEPQSFQMQPGGSQTVTVNVSVPTGAGEGTRYAIVNVTGTPGTGSENVGLAVEVGVSSLITLTGTSQTHTGAIKNLAVAKPVPGQPLAVTGTVQNTGNSHFGAAPNQVNTSATLTNANGDTVSAGKQVMTGNSIVPSYGRQFSVPLKTSQPLGDGRYHLRVEAVLQDGTLLDSASLDFTLTGGEVVLGATANGQGDSGPSGTLLLLIAALCAAVIGSVAVNLLLLGRRRRNERRNA
jgi:hypothetical protein